jgi:oxepin-CoA hydrolase/3-oxo-5,6-dehydrosuberyl-CoA semialdehyde dehydrogenase
MTSTVSSYVAGKWFVGSGTGTPILDASTGAQVATVSAEGLDTAALVDHARTVGGPVLRAMTFHQRAKLLADLAEYLGGRTGELHAAYGTAGGTLADARVDVEGGIQTLGVYARRGLRDLPDDTVYAEDAPRRLGAAEFVGQTVYTSRAGVCVFINAFNFPVWGMLEKLAPALLAGLPAIVKPATATAHLAELAVRQIVDSGILPDGALQLVSGSLGDVLDRLGGQDSVAFTGSATTAAKLRAHPAVVERGTRFNAEADSLNATVLGPDATPETEEFGLFVKSVFRELTGKTGQKCTAIRRVLVPHALVDDVVEALRGRLTKVVIGDPRVSGTTMGPLVSTAQRDEVANAVRGLLAGADAVIGGPDATLDIASGDPDKGAFFPPTVLVAKQIRDPELHRIEAFGPVTTVFGYDDATDAAELAALGEGSLVASVVSHDPAFVREVVRAIAPFHGRVLVLDRIDAKAAAPHGAVLPTLIHGGPGRAGGGEELGGIRGVLHQMQATSVAGAPDMLVAVTGTWNNLATPKPGDTHPFRKHFEDLAIGETLITGTRTLTERDVDAFADLSGDHFYAHTDEAAAAANPLFGARVAHGYLVLSAAAGLFVDPAPGPVLANFGLDRLRFVKPVYFGDTIGVRLTVKSKTIRPDGSGEITWDVGVTNGDGELVASYDLLTINARRAG